MLKDFTIRIRVLTILMICLVLTNIPLFHGKQNSLYEQIVTGITVLEIIVLLLGIYSFRSQYRSQKCLMRKLSETETRYKALVNNAPVFFWAVDSSERITMFEGKALALLGYQQQEMVGHRYSEVFTDPEAQRVLQEVLNGTCMKLDMKIGDSWFETVLIPNLSEDSEEEKHEGVIGISLDVTERKVSEQEARKSTEAKSRFLANMSHEIRTPIGIISGFADLALQPTVKSAERLDLLAKIRHNSELLHELVNDILDLSKVEAGKLEVECREVNLQSLLCDIVETFTYKSREKELKFVTEIKTPLPLKISSDPTRLRQILMNLLGNALKFTEKGHIKLTASSRHISPVICELTFMVEDTGIGMTKDQVNRLFKPFTQADSSMTRKYGGTGLGLALSKKLALGLNGDLQIDKSEMGKGSVFSVKIICQVVYDEMFSQFAPFTRDHLSLVSESPARLEGLKVLLVEDSADNQYLVKRLLKGAGAEVVIASDGKAGVETALDGNFDVVLMDIQMPKMDGFEATQVLRQNSYNRKIIALTANALKEERDRALLSGFDGYLTKPIQKQTLLKTLFEAHPVGI